MFAETFRNYTRARSDNLYVSVVLLSTVQRFFRTLKKGHKPETFLFFFKKYLTLFDFFFFYRISPYQLLEHKCHAYLTVFPQTTYGASAN